MSDAVLQQLLQVGALGAGGVRKAVVPCVRAHATLLGAPPRALQDFHGGRGLDIALQWLHLLFLEKCRAFTSEAEGVDTKRQGASVTEAGWDGSAYERVLLALLRGLRDVLPATDRTLIRRAVGLCACAQVVGREPEQQAKLRP